MWKILTRALKKHLLKKQIFQYAFNVKEIMLTLFIDIVKNVSMNTRNIIHHVQKSAEIVEILAKCDNTIKPFNIQQTSDLGSEMPSSDLNSETISSTLASVSMNCSSSNQFLSENNPKSNSDLCIFCNDAPKNSIFLHTNIAHCCCCFACAKKTLRSIKKCPICNGSVNKVVRIFTA